MKPGDKSVLTYSKEAYTSLYGKVFASEISSWARSIQSQGLDEMLTQNPLATTPLVNLGGLITDIHGIYMGYKWDIYIYMGYIPPIAEVLQR